jgi:1-deoxy-D-xylulose-5-phosphate synthase
MLFLNRLSTGHPGNFAVEAYKELVTNDINTAHYDMLFVKPLDEQMLHEVFKKYDKILTVEDGRIIGGFGRAVLEFMGDHGYSAKVKRLGIPDYVVQHGSQQELWHECGYDAQGMVEAVRELVGEHVSVEVKD